MANGYLLWTACGAGLRLPVKTPWLITSAISPDQEYAFNAAASAFMQAEDEEHSRVRDEYDAFKKAKRSKKSDSVGLDGPDKAKEVDLKERASQTCQPVMFDLHVSHDRIVQLLRDSKYRSTAVIDSGTGRATAVTGSPATARKRLNYDPILRALHQKDFGMAMLRSTTGGSVMLKSFERAAFYNMTIVQDASSVKENIRDLTTAIGGRAIVLPGNACDAYDMFDFRTLFDTIHKLGREPLDMVFDESWSRFWDTVPDIGETKFTKSAVEKQQLITSWGSIKGLVVGVLAAEKMLACNGVPGPDDLRFKDGELDSAWELLVKVAEIAYSVETYDKSSLTRGANASLAREARAQKFQEDTANNVHEWFIAVQNRLLSRPGHTAAYNSLVRGPDRVLTAGQMDAVLEQYVCDIANTPSGVRLLREPMTAVDPDVQQAMEELATVVRNLPEGQKPWIRYDDMPAGCKLLWRDMRRQYPASVIKFVVQGETVVTVLQDEDGWLYPWRFIPEVVKAAEEYEIKLQ